MKTPSPSASLSQRLPPPWPTPWSIHRSIRWEEPRDVLRTVQRAADALPSPSRAAAAYGCVDWFIYPDSLD